ncbi:MULTISPECIES: alpha,alpha-trehalase TreF [Sphingobium]|uniref:Cytoplasmic trehalase n=1 Tax=Sphingobium fuliginis (strain ATCC 27551) TaxID=336203 RepID=A0ABQ1F376_SPHSA|nr:MULTISPECIES: alpha,alpha-trehalase TreF [Sphingobium]WDA35924.1 alpha,alpha-trehalase TreF [Sphingobium sp. YC-XJ3]GFZ98093.1 cytoplasmic trehalase [Sphingobium fuliginis]
MTTLRSAPTFIDYFPEPVQSGTACGLEHGRKPPSGKAGYVATPADLYGAMLAQVQLNQLFEDGKTFVDAVPRRSTDDILRAFEALPHDSQCLRDFVIAHFDLPDPAGVHPAHGEPDLRHYIRSIWPELHRDGAHPPENGSLLPVNGPYVVPGGRFVELYYWDSYFSILGLLRDGFEHVAQGIVTALADLLKRYGRIPNGTRSYYLSRSQPPLYFAMLDLVPDARPAVMRQRLDALLIEHGFWMDGAAALGPGECAKRVVRMPDGALLNRYWDDRDTPRDESYLEDVATANATMRPPEDVFRALRAGAESGWDFSSRWFTPGGALDSIRTHHIVAVDLNAFLYGMESAIVRLADELCEDRIARQFDGARKRRRAAIHRWLWCEAGYFSDFDLESGQLCGQLTAATHAPLFTGVATQAQAAAVARLTSDHLIAPGGLRTTLIETGEQWDAPNGWAPLQWIAFMGLRRYGHRRLADIIAARWVETVDSVFQRTGWIHEKYDVERGIGGGGGEYTPQLGFGWTNGVTAAFMDLLRIHSSGREGRGPVTVHGVPDRFAAMPEGPIE